MKKFISQFTQEQVVDEKSVRKIGDDYYLVPQEIAKTLSRVKLPPLYSGLYLGRFAQKSSKPSLDMLQMLAKTGAKKAWLNDTGAWMFICRRPALKASITKCEAKAGELVLVMNQHNECLGYGLFDGKNIKNYYDIGDFLRRERRAKRR
jgi:ribosome biogenesis protein Nip4